MNNPVNPVPPVLTEINRHPVENDRIAFLADKFGVSRQTVLIIMSVAGPDDKAIEDILRQNRVTR